jgi:hypothetical protein
MAHRKSHRKSHRRRYKRNFVKRTLDSSVNIAKSTSKKYMPKVKTSVENMGSKVVHTGETSIPYLQKMTRKFFSMFSKTKKNRKH